MNLKEKRNQAVGEAVMISESVAVLFINPNAEIKQFDKTFARFNLIVRKVKIDYSSEGIPDLLWGLMLSTLRRKK